MINPIVKTIELPDGRTITLETGKLAVLAQADISATTPIIAKFLIVLIFFVLNFI